MNRSMVITVSTAVLFLGAAGLVHAGDPAVSCESGKLKVAGKYASCRLSAEAKAVKTGDPVDYTKCNGTYGIKWAVAQGKGEGMCPGGEVDEEPIQSFIDECDDAIAVALSGGGLPLGVGTCNGNLTTCAADLATCDADLLTCQGDLASCEADPAGQTLQTGQTGCWSSGGTSVPCAGTGQDGELQNGVARSFTDNGDGTITDEATGLMWEKLSDDGTIHDLDNNYTWDDAFAVKVATLNSSSFAGYNDWRVPNIAELQTLVNYSASGPAVYPEFDTGCVASCSVLTCSCTRPGSSSGHWSSTTKDGSPARAWRLDFFDGATTWTDVTKAAGRPVRAVRGGQ